MVARAPAPVGDIHRVGEPLERLPALRRQIRPASQDTGGGDFGRNGELARLIATAVSNESASRGRILVIQKLLRFARGDGHGETRQR